jgi:hypothetical protein
MLSKKTIKIIEDVQPDKMDISFLKNDNIQTIDTYLTGIKIYLEKATLEELNNYQETITKINNDLTTSIQTLMDCSDKVIEINETIKKQVSKLQTITKIKKDNKFMTLTDLITNLTNIDQINRLYKILPDNQDYAKVYLQGYNKNTDLKKQNLLGTIKILGQYNFKKKERETYEIKILKNEPYTFWCSCIDQKLNSARKGTVCKHIAFIVCKVMKILELEFFETKKLSYEQINKLLDRFSDKSELWKNKDLVRNIEKITINFFKNFPTPIDDVCSFCYDDMTDNDIPNSVCCPMCNHTYHIECIDIWLENYQKCSVCSSEIWKHYIAIKKGDNTIVNNKL